MKRIRELIIAGLGRSGFNFWHVEKFNNKDTLSIFKNMQDQIKSGLSGAEFRELKLLVEKEEKK